MNGNVEKRKCSKCGKCCANILLLTSSEITNIQKFIRKNNIKPVNRNSIVFLSDKEYVNCCPFLSKEMLCNIYSVRPQICREFECSTFCDLNKNTKMNYQNIKAINMLKTFFPNEYCPENDEELNIINKRINELAKIIGGKNNG